ncbi:hypothetical protein KIV63_gp10 [Mycobacterium phage SWU2]|uniref:Gene product 88 domain-containing protein n=1 Tax=Mycobacterium phage SWU2 TaxID=2077150 RepID=A0A2K9VI59_9CAUD|nr:hypothetical protein KIV63_gp10 [Mycobacterium phage SWU2]AUV62034.1 hypothetical protein JX_gp75 [Mycobacterium phage SWU2]
MSTRVENILINADFGAAVIAGLQGSPDVRQAREAQAKARASVGYREASADMLTSGASQQKLSKNTLPSFGLMLTPERGMMADSLADVRQAFGITGPINLCPMASKGCAAACLSRSGQSGMPAQQRAQAVRTAFLLSHPREAGLIIGAEIRKALRRHGRINLRLNTTSDIRWERVAPDMVQALADAGVLMYDYTAWSPSDRAESDDYSLTYSAKETSHTSDDYLQGILASGGNVAMPFTTRKGEALPEVWNGYRVIDGDESDERRNDPRGVVVGLRAKGHEWKKDNSGFIRQA